MKDTNLKPQVLVETVKTLLPRTYRYVVILFLLLLLGVYAFVILRIRTFSSVQPDQTAVNTQIRSSVVPHVNPAVIKEMQTLRDNSVNVQTLFDQARNSPFQE